MTREEFAKKLGQEYRVKIDPKNLTRNEATMYEFVTAIFPPHKVVEWLEKEGEHIKQLRVRFDLKPYDKFDAVTKQEIAKLKNENFQG